jgi:multidrug efflux pump subunit AcrB
VLGAADGEVGEELLTELGERVVKVALERAEGVGEVEVFGGLPRTVNIWVDADRLAAYKLPVTEVRSAIARQNATIPGGNPWRFHRSISPKQSTGHPSGGTAGTVRTPLEPLLLRFERVTRARSIASS